MDITHCNGATLSKNLTLPTSVVDWGKVIITGCRCILYDWASYITTAIELDLTPKTTTLQWGNYPNSLMFLICGKV